MRSSGRRALVSPAPEILLDSRPTLVDLLVAQPLNAGDDRGREAAARRLCRDELSQDHRTQAGDVDRHHPAAAPPPPPAPPSPPPASPPAPSPAAPGRPSAPPRAPPLPAGRPAAPRPPPPHSPRFAPLARDPCVCRFQSVPHSHPGAWCVGS